MSAAAIDVRRRRRHRCLGLLLIAAVLASGFGIATNSTTTPSDVLDAAGVVLTSEQRSCVDTVVSRRPSSGEYATLSPTERSSLWKALGVCVDPLSPAVVPLIAHQAGLDPADPAVWCAAETAIATLGPTGLTRMGQASLATCAPVE